MNSNEVKELFVRIKALYPTFSANQDVKNEWEKWLIEYSNDGVNKNLTKWYEERPDEIPKIVNLINEFIRVKPRYRFIACNYCKTSFRDDDIESLKEHEDRHRSVKYIKRKEHLLNQNYDENKLMSMNDEAFEKAYDRFLELIYQVITDSSEKSLLEKCISKTPQQFNISEVM